MEEDEKKGIRQRSIAIIFVNKMKTGEFLINFIRENWQKGPSKRSRAGKKLAKKLASQKKEENQKEEKEEDEASDKEENGTKQLRIDFLNSKMSQPVREKILNSFKSGKTQFLISTDVVNRGIDIPNLNYVLNYDFPTNLVTYVHRIGRTGRNNTPGYARSFITRNMSPLVPDLVRILEANSGREGEL